MKSIWLAKVVDTADPYEIGRVRVEYIEHSSKVVGDDDAKWILPMLPTTSAGVKGIGRSPGISIGSVVVGTYLDYPTNQNPIIIGVIATKTDNEDDLSKYFTGKGEPKLPSKDTTTLLYGTCDVWSSTFGHIVFDNANHRLVLEHTSGSSVVLDKEGNITVKAKKVNISSDEYNVDAKTISLKGSNVKIDSDIVDIKSQTFLLSSGIASLKATIFSIAAKLFSIPPH